jgi:hypothetical protein
MKLMQWLSFSIIFILIVIHGIWPKMFMIDSLSMLLLFLLAIPLLAPFLKKAKLLGAEFEFKDEIKKVKELVDKSVEQARKDHGDLIGRNENFETFLTSSAQRIAVDDPNLALAALRIDMERVLTHAVKVLIQTNEKHPLPITKSASLLLEHGLISKEQEKAIFSITKICNKAVHGGEVSRDEAGEVLFLAKRLNDSFPLGYSINFFPNTSYKDQGLVCEWEHCIENMGIVEEPTDVSCEVFGHDCPGGVAIREDCKKSIHDIPPERFA